MIWKLRTRFNLSSVFYMLGSHLDTPVYRGAQFTRAVAASSVIPVDAGHILVSMSCACQIPFSRFTTSSNDSTWSPTVGKGIDFADENGGGGEGNGVLGIGFDSDGADVSSENDDDDGGGGTEQLGVIDEKLNRDIGAILDILQGKGENSGSGPMEVRNKLDQCGITVSSDLVIEVLSRTRNDWEMAFMFFLWAGKHPGYVHSLRVYHSMISILTKRRKFDTAWGLIDEMKRSREGVSLVTPNTLLIMIRRYCAIHDVGNAINTFHAFKRFNFHVGIEEFQKLLAALCRYKNVQDAEHLLFSNRNTFPFETKSFNIILNGWFNIVGSPREGNRFWKVMIERQIKLDVVSYSSIISSYSKSNKLKDVLRLYDRMKGMGIAPDRKVYNAVIHALAKAGLVRESLNLLKAMEKDGVTPNTITYNSLIKPLSRARKMNEAREVFDEMLHRGLQPTIRTFHALLRVQRTSEDIFLLLDKMKQVGCQPNKDTYVMLIRKFCRWGQLDNVFKLWNEMSQHGLNDDSSSHIVLIHGLFLNGKLEEAHRVYMEMKEKSLLPDAKTDELIQMWLSNKEMADLPALESAGNSHNLDNGGESSLRLEQERSFQKRPKGRRVQKEHGFSHKE